ncbi:MAG: ABC transporter permease [Coriobacteriia bacterium]|nr:ABC transporter permease [Coriobacteriia bacterium]
MALSGALVALVSCVALPFVESSANRIVSGVPVRLWTAAPLWAALLFIALAGALTAAVVQSQAARRYRGPALLASAVATWGCWLLALGSAAVRLTPAGDTPARVSIGVGAWLMLAGVVAVWYQGARASHRMVTVAAAGAAIVLPVVAVLWGGLAWLSLALEYRAQADTFWTLVVNHIYLSLGGTAIAAALGIPLGILAARRRVVRATAIPVVGVIQTVPSLALFGLLMVPLAALGLPSIGPLPVLIALTLYALLPIVRSTYLGIAGVDAAIADAGRGMGMSRAELLRRVEFPLALPLVLEGVRVALVLTIGIAAVMAIGGAQDLGTLVFLGWGSQAADLTLLGALPMVALSIAADRGMRALERAIVSPGIRRERAAA